MIIRLAAASLLVLLAACTAAPAPSATPAVTVQMSATNNVFDPQSLNVPAGAVYAIQFTNNDTVPHNVAITNGPPGSKGEVFGGPGERTYVFPALTAGSYQFFCEVHPEMIGTIQAT